MQDSDKSVQYLANIDLGIDPHLVLGRRGPGRKGIEAVQVELLSDLHGPLRAICERAVEKVQATDARPYEPTAELESGDEHFFLEVDQIPTVTSRAESGTTIERGVVAVNVSDTEDGENPERTAALIQALQDISLLEYANRSDLPEYKPLFYSISWQQSSREWAHFIRKSNPMQVLKPGRIWTQYSDALARIDQPTMAIDDEVDIILAEGVMRAFKSAPVKDLFTDVHLVMRDVPVYVKKVQDLLSASVPLSSEAAAAIEVVAHKKYSTAVRLYNLPERISQLTLTIPQLRRVLNQHDLDQQDLLSRDKKFAFGEEMVPAFLDVIESRYFEDDWTGEFRRADRYSKRSGSGE